MDQRKTPELLVPAGDFEKLKYAFAYGADAVYAGAPQYSLRARENGFNEEMIFEGVRYAHARNKKFYLTANILAHNRKIRPFLESIGRLMEARPDALIMADPGLIHLVKQRFPDTEIHLSVQANVMSWATAKFWHDAGVRRIILSRELSIREIREIKDHVPEIELEAFVHGAICIAHSGRCLLSNYFNHRDANLGACTNACRWPYKLYSKPPSPHGEDLNQRLDLLSDFYLEEKERPDELMRIDEDEYGTYIMNARDLMAIEYLDQMWEAGLDSFKIEGRTKSVYYLSITTHAYRQAIDNLVARKPFDPELVKTLEKLHHRGYTSGFLVPQSKISLQRYEEGRTNIYSQEFGGIVIDSTKDKMLIKPRNKISIGDRLEVITPQSGSFVIPVEQMNDLHGTPLLSIHGGTEIETWIPIPKGPLPEFTVISRLL